MRNKSATGRVKPGSTPSPSSVSASVSASAGSPGLPPRPVPAMVKGVMDPAALFNALPVVLPPVAFLGAWRLLATGGRPWQRAFLIAAVLCGLLVVATNEFLSPLHALARPAVIAAWALAQQGVLVALVARGRQPLGRNQRRSRLLLGAMLLPLALVALGALTVAIAATPNNWDSMTYHLARVANWEQNRSIAHYPTAIGRQDYMPPLAEWMVLHLQLLAGSDRLANCVQWASWAGCMVAASSAARALGAGRVAQGAAAVLVGTLPMAILQASSTQNDLAVAFWLSAFAALALPPALRVIRDPQPWWGGAAEFAPAGLALGLALLTKGTALLFAPPLAAVALGFTIRRRRRNAVMPAACVIALALAVPAGHWWRNAMVCGSPFGPGREEYLREQGQKYASDKHAPSIILSTLVRDVSLELQWPDLRHLTGVGDWDQPLADWFDTAGWTEWTEDFNKSVAPAVRAWHARHGLDPDDPLTVWNGMRYEVSDGWNFEDNAAAPAQVGLIALSLFILPLRRPRVGGRALVYLLAVGAGLVLFAAVLRWQPWHNRLMLPVLILAMPAVAVALEGLLTPVGLAVAAVLLPLAAVPWVVHNKSRPMFAAPDGAARLGRRSIFVGSAGEQRFFLREADRAAYARVAAAVVAINPRATVGLQSGVDDWEYPLWAALREAGWAGRLEHVGFVNDTVTTADPDAPPPEVVVSVEGRPRVVRGRQKAWRRCQ